VRNRKVIPFPKEKKSPFTLKYKGGVGQFSAILEEVIKRELNKKAARKEEDPPEEDEG
jgi:hypothetical protein